MLTSPTIRERNYIVWFSSTFQTVTLFAEKINEGDFREIPQVSSMTRRRKWNLLIKYSFRIAIWIFREVLRSSSVTSKWYLLIYNSWFLEFSDSKIKEFRNFWWAKFSCFSIDKFNIPNKIIQPYLQRTKNHYITTKTNRYNTMIHWDTWYQDSLSPWLIKPTYYSTWYLEEQNSINTPTVDRNDWISLTTMLYTTSEKWYKCFFFQQDKYKKHTYKHRIHIKK